MAASVEEVLPRLTELPIPLLNELLQYADVVLQARLRRTCALFNLLLLPRVAACREIRIFIHPRYPPGFCNYLFCMTLKRFHANCIAWFGHSPIRTVIVEGPDDHACELQDFCISLDSVKNLDFQQIIFVRQTFRDPFYLSDHTVSCQNNLKKKNICQQLTFHDVIFSQLQNVLNPEDVIGERMGRDERKAYMVQEQIIPIRGSLDVRSARFDHDLLDLVERHCPELDESQMADMMQWKATCQDRWCMGYRLRDFIAHDDRPYNALYRQGWHGLDAGSHELVTAARAVDVRQMTKMARTAFFYCMQEMRREDERQADLRERKKALLTPACSKSM